MTEQDRFPVGPEASDITNPGPNSAIYKYFLRVAQPAQEEVMQAAELVNSEYREIEGLQDILSVSMDLVKFMSQPTTVLASMIGTGHEAVPKRWRSDPDDIRMFLTMTGNFEIAYLKSLKPVPRRGGELMPGSSERIEEIEQLINDLE